MQEIHRLLTIHSYMFGMDQRADQRKLCNRCTQSGMAFPGKSYAHERYHEATHHSI